MMIICYLYYIIGQFLIIFSIDVKVYEVKMLVLDYLQLYSLNIFTPCFKADDN